MSEYTELILLRCPRHGRAVFTSLRAHLPAGTETCWDGDYFAVVRQGDTAEDGHDRRPLVIEAVFVWLRAVRVRVDVQYAIAQPNSYPTVFTRSHRGQGRPATTPQCGLHTGIWCERVPALRFGGYDPADVFEELWDLSTPTKGDCMYGATIEAANAAHAAAIESRVSIHSPVRRGENIVAVRTDSAPNVRALEWVLGEAGTGCRTVFFTRSGGAAVRVADSDMQVLRNPSEDTATAGMYEDLLQANPSLIGRVYEHYTATGTAADEWA